jgi:hypothetical protein
VAQGGEIGSEGYKPDGIGHGQAAEDRQRRVNAG